MTKRYAKDSPVVPHKKSTSWLNATLWKNIGERFAIHCFKDERNQRLKDMIFGDPCHHSTRPAPLRRCWDSLTVSALRVRPSRISLGETAEGPLRDSIPTRGTTFPLLETCDTMKHLSHSPSYMELPAEKSPLIPGESYIITKRVEVKHMVGRGQIGKLILEVGDVIAVKSNDPLRGLSFVTTKYLDGTVIVSQRQAASIDVEGV